MHDGSRKFELRHDVTLPKRRVSRASGSPKVRTPTIARAGIKPRAAREHRRFAEDGTPEAILISRTPPFHRLAVQVASRMGRGKWTPVVRVSSCSKGSDASAAQTKL